jgi:hypothetical protein
VRLRFFEIALPFLFQVRVHGALQRLRVDLDSADLRFQRLVQELVQLLLVIEHVAVRLAHCCKASGFLPSFSVCQQRALTLPVKSGARCVLYNAAAKIAERGLLHPLARYRASTAGRSPSAVPAGPAMGRRGPAVLFCITRANVRTTLAGAR